MRQFLFTSVIVKKETILTRHCFAIFSILGEYEMNIGASLSASKSPMHETTRSDNNLTERKRRKDVPKTVLAPPKLQNITTGLF